MTAAGLNHRGTPLAAPFAGIELASTKNAPITDCAIALRFIGRWRRTTSVRRIGLGRGPSSGEADMATTKARFDITGRIGKITPTGNAVKGSLGADAFWRSANDEKTKITLWKTESSSAKPPNICLHTARSGTWCAHAANRGHQLQERQGRHRP